MKDAHWIDGHPPNASPATWVDANGRGCIDPLAFAVADEATRQALFDEAARKQREHAEYRANVDEERIVCHAFEPASAAADDLPSAINEVIAANMRLIQQLGVLRDQAVAHRQGQGGSS